MPAHADPLPIPPRAGPVSGRVLVPGSKSESNRALLIAGLARGTSRLTGLLDADDTRVMLANVQRLGATARMVDGAPGSVELVGNGGRLPAGAHALWVELAGTAARFLPAVLATGPGRYVVDGTQRMRERPMAPLIAALRRLGAQVVCLEREGHLPIAIEGGRPLAGEVEIAGDASSQFLSGLAIAGPLLPRGLRLTLTGPLVSAPYVELTARTMEAWGASIERPRAGSAPGPGATWAVAPGGYVATSRAIEPDASSASYFFAAAAITGGRVEIPGLGAGSPQGDLGLVRIFEAMGCRVVQTPTSTAVLGPPPGTLRGVEVDMRDMSDVAQTLAVVAAFAQTPTRITGIGFIRHKESDRIANVVRELSRMGVGATVEPDGYVIEPRPGAPHGARIETYGDHRMAMAFAVAGLVVPGIEIVDPACVAKTFPGYFEVLAGL